MRSGTPESDWRRQRRDIHINRHKGVDRRYQNPSSLPTPHFMQSATDMILRLALTLPSTQGSLVESFVRGNGQQSVANGIRNHIILHPQDFTPQDLHKEMVMKAIGIVHDRIAYALLLQRYHQPGYMIPDPGASIRLSKAIDQAINFYLSLRGAVISQADSNPTLEALCEYKANPLSSGTKENLPTRLRRLVSFVDTFRGQGFDIYALIDTRRNIIFDHIEVAPEAKVLLLSPFDKQPDYSMPQVTLLPTPLRHNLLYDIAEMCTQDLVSPFN